MSNIPTKSCRIRNLLQRLRAGGMAYCPPGAGQALLDLDRQERVNTVKLFFSYSHKDEELRDELAKHLSILKQEGVIEVWHDRNIGPGAEWGGEIDENLNTADIILLLISADFLASDYCYKQEALRAMKRHDAGEAVVIPILLRPVDNWSNSPFGRLQAMPKDLRAITTWPNPEDAFVEVASGIRQTVEKLLQARYRCRLFPIYNGTRSGWQRIKQLFSYIVAKSKLIVTGASIATALAMLFVNRDVVRCKVSSAIFTEGKYETEDPIDKTTKVSYVTGPGQVPVDVGWKFVEVESSCLNPQKRVITRLVEGDIIGIFKDEYTRNDFNLYRNFILEFSFKFLNRGEGSLSPNVAWVVRAKDFRNFYLIEITPSRDKSDQGVLQFSVYQNGVQTRNLSPQGVLVDLGKLGDDIKVKMRARGNQFEICVAALCTTPSYKRVKSIYDDIFCYGGIGFLPRKGAGIYLQYLSIKKDDGNHATELCED